MDREKFVEELHKMDPDYNPGYVKRPTEIDDVIQACINHAKNNYMQDNNMYQLAVVIEEMAELTQELTKMLRGRDDRQKDKKCKKKSTNVPKELAALYTKEFEDKIKSIDASDKNIIRMIVRHDQRTIQQLPNLTSTSVSGSLMFIDPIIGRVVYESDAETEMFYKFKSMIVESKFTNINQYAYTFIFGDECNWVLVEYRKIIEECIFNKPILLIAIERMLYLLNL